MLGKVTSMDYKEKAILKKLKDLVLKVLGLLIEQ